MGVRERRSIAASGRSLRRARKPQGTPPTPSLPVCLLRVSRAVGHTARDGCGGACARGGNSRRLPSTSSAVLGLLLTASTRRVLEHGRHTSALIVLRGWVAQSSRGASEPPSRSRRHCRAKAQAFRSASAVASPPASRSAPTPETLSCRQRALQHCHPPYPPLALSTVTVTRFNRSLPTAGTVGIVPNLPWRLACPPREPQQAWYWPSRTASAAARCAAAHAMACRDVGSLTLYHSTGCIFDPW